MIDENQKILDDLIVYKYSDHFLLIINASNTKKDLDWINSQITGDTKIKNVTSKTGMLAIQGPNVLEKLQTLSSSFKE